jgi:transcriptional regulator with XRE-family HTH domain
MTAKRIPAKFYRTEAGTEPVRDWLKSLNQEERRLRGLSKTEMAKAMKTSRAALNRLLDPENTAVTLNTMERAARAVGKQLKLYLVDVGNES